MNKKTFYFLGIKFSITKFDSWGKQSIHLVIHAGVTVAVSFINPMAGLIAGLGLALLIEIWDGTKKVNKEGRPSEGFNIFPDFFFRVLGAVLGFLAAELVFTVVRFVHFIGGLWL